MAHLGVIQELKEVGITLDSVVGTSVYALMDTIHADTIEALRIPICTVVINIQTGKVFFLRLEMSSRPVRNSIFMQG